MIPLSKQSKLYLHENVNDHKQLILDSKLSFISHINEKISKAHKGLDFTKSLSRFLPVKTLDLIFKLYIRPHLDFCDVIFHIPSITNPFDSSINLNYLMNTLERIQYHAAIAISGGSWKGTNLNRIYDDVDVFFTFIKFKIILLLLT